MSERVHFDETQRLAWWIKALALLPVVAIGTPAVAAWVTGSLAGGFVLTALAALFALLAYPVFVVRLVTRLEADCLRLRIVPARVFAPFLPARVRDIPLTDIEHCEARGYRAFSDREFWGPHFWGLGTSTRGDAHLYLMSGKPFSAPAVRLDLADGDKVLVGSSRPDELAAAIERAKGAAV